MSRSKRWCFTLNNPPDNLEDVHKHKDVSFLVYQLEEGKKKTSHFQGYLELKRRLRLKNVQKIFDPHRPHLEIARGSQQQNIDYCTKDKTRVK